MNKSINISSILKQLDDKMYNWASDRVIFKMCRNLLTGNKLNRSNV